MEVAAVIDDDGIAIALHPPRVCYRACRSGMDWVSVVGVQVNTRMVGILPCDRVNTVALRARDDHRINGGDHRYRRCGGCGKEREEGEHERDEQVHPAHISKTSSQNWDLSQRGNYATLKKNERTDDNGTVLGIKEERTCAAATTAKDAGDGTV